MRVAQVVTDMTRGGAERVVADLLSHAPPGVETALFTITGQGPLQEEVAAGGVPVVSIGKGRGFRPAALVRLARALARFDPQVVHSHMLPADAYATPAVGLLLPARRRPAVVHTVHSAWPWRTALERRLSLYLQARHAANIAVSTEVHGVLATAGWDEARLVTITPGVDTARLQARPAEVAAWRRKLDLGEGPVVGSVGRLSAEKGHRYLVGACGELRTQYPGLRLLLVGDGRERASLEQQAAELLPGQCIFAGAQAEVAPLLALMDVFCLPSVVEGLPLAALEAMAAGRPVVATAVGGVPGLVVHEREGLLAEPRSGPALAKAIGHLLDHPAQAGQLAAAGRAKVLADYDVAVMARRHYALYASLAGEAAP